MKTKYLKVQESSVGSEGADETGTRRAQTNRERGSRRAPLRTRKAKNDDTLTGAVKEMFRGAVFRLDERI